MNGLHFINYADCSLFIIIMYGEVAYIMPIWLWLAKGQLISEWIYKVIVSFKMPIKNLKDFCLGSLLEGRAEILQIFG